MSSGQADDICVFDRVQQVSGIPSSLPKLPCRPSKSLCQLGDPHGTRPLKPAQQGVRMDAWYIR
jgi:hypothetical protein